MTFARFSTSQTNMCHVVMCRSFGSSTQHWPMLLELLAALPEEVSRIYLHCYTEHYSNSSISTVYKRF